MSRCLPFPPPGYIRNGARSEALIESIKLQRDREKTDKERKKEKEERRKEREVKDGRAKHPYDGKGKESNISKLKYPQLEKTRAEGSIGGLQKRDDDDNEQLERSGISEEHDQPVSSRGLGCLSDSTQTSKKRRRNTSPSSHDLGNVIRIRLPLRIHKELEASQHDDQLVSTSGSVGRMGTKDSFPQETNGSLPQRRNFTNVEAYQCIQDNELGRLIQDSAATLSGGNSLANVSQTVESVYNSIFQNWLPLPLKFEGSNSEDVDWLFPSELQGRSKQLKPSANGRCCSSPTLWPRAQCLPEVEIYALPYAIPF